MSIGHWRTLESHRRQQCKFARVIPYHSDRDELLITHSGYTFYQYAVGIRVCFIELQ